MLTVLPNLVSFRNPKIQEEENLNLHVIIFYFFASLFCSMGIWLVHGIKGVCICPLVGQGLASEISELESSLDC
jgi:hypothetical protein